MAAAVDDAQPESIVGQLVQPAILKLLGEPDGLYRCERDLHHHFTVCFNNVKALQLGTGQRQKAEYIERLQQAFDSHVADCHREEIAATGADH